MIEANKLKCLQTMFGNNFIGPDQLIPIKEKMGIEIPENIYDILPLVQYSDEILEKCKEDYILILGIPFYKGGLPLTIKKMREHLRVEPEKYEPCFYNQDWYINEKFANKTTLKNRWYLLKKNVFEEYRGISPNIIIDEFDINLQLPTAILCAFTFFAYYFNSKGGILWKNDFVWCSDKDSFNDQIYIGRYCDLKGINKNGFNIHRHLSIKNNYSYLNLID